MQDHIYYQECILGIKINGVSCKIDALQISDDQTSYDYICNVSPSRQVNGNGSFDITILNQEFNEGMPLGKWTLLGGTITYDWGESKVTFILQDENGIKTNPIVSGNSKGSARGFQIEGLARSIFSKAREIVTEYPTATIYNIACEFRKIKFSDYDVKSFAKKSDASALIDDFEDTITHYRKYLENFRKLKDLLSTRNDEKSSKLLKIITAECVETIMRLS